MSTSTMAAETAAQTTLASRLKEALAAQSSESPLDYRDSCDNCTLAARSVFVFPVAEIMLCGHHMRLSLENLMANNPTGFWIQPDEIQNMNRVAEKQEVRRR